MPRPSPSASREKPLRAVNGARPRGRPPVISNEKLLEVAREVFLELGIRATTLEVAQRAGVAEGTIFHRFKSKEDLFRAAMQFDPDTALAFVERFPEQAGKGELRATLLEFTEEFLRVCRIAVPVMMMSWSNPDGQLSQDRLCDKGERHRRAVRAITAFFDGEMRAGRVATMDPEVLARMLLGSLHHYCMSELFTPGAVALPPQRFAREVVEVLLRAALAAPAVKSTRRAAEAAR